MTTLIKAAINGGRSKAEHQQVPVTPEEIAFAVVGCLQAGASAIHFHVRSPTGEESLAAADLTQALNAIRKTAPTAQVGISTGDWIVRDHFELMMLVSEWTELPDFASVNFHEVGAIELARTLHAKGIGVEAGLSNQHSAEEFVVSGLAPQCLRVLIEPQEQQLDDARRTVDSIRVVLDHAHLQIPWLLHGTEATAWQILDDALRLGYDIRMGFEDTLSLPDGTSAQSNAELISSAKHRLMLAS